MTSDRITGALFLAIAAGLILGARSFPSGVGSLPGPGFFPLIIAAVMVALALLLFAPRPAQPTTASIASPGRLAAVITLLALYLALWGFGGFAPRTVIFATLLLALFGESWKRAALVSVLMTAFVVAAFQFGLRVTLE